CLIALVVRCNKCRDPVYNHSDWTLTPLSARDVLNKERQMLSSQNWIFWALLSAVFAALVAIFAKIGLEGIDSDYATLLRTFVIIVVLSLFVGITGKWRNPITLSPRTGIFLALSALATGASWVCYFRALKIGEAHKVAPVDKLSVVLVAVFA